MGTERGKEVQKNLGLKPDEREVDVPQRKRDLLIMVTLTAVLTFFVFSVWKFNNLASSITDNNEEIAHQSDTLAGAVKSLVKVTDSIRRANITGCAGQNEIRTVLRKQYRKQIKQSHTTDYEVFFPGVNPQALHDAIHQQNSQLWYQINHDLRGRHCRSKYSVQRT